MINNQREKPLLSTWTRAAKTDLPQTGKYGSEVLTAGHRENSTGEKVLTGWSYLHRQDPSPLTAAGREGGGRWEEQCTEKYLYPTDINCRTRRQARDPALFPPPHALSPQMQLPPLNRIKGELFSLLLSHLGGESLPGKGLSVFQMDKAMTNTHPLHCPFLRI